MAKKTDAPAKGGNQSEAEYFAIVTKGRKGVEDMLTIMRPEFTRIAAPTIRDNYSAWEGRALMDIISRNELHPILQTRKGLFSIAKGLSQCLIAGIQFGGHFPQAYFMPEGETAELDITWEGFAFIAAYGPGAVLEKAPMLIRVFDADAVFLIDQGAGKVDHQYDPRFPEKRGKLCGWYMKLEYRDGTVEIPFVSVAKVRDINAKYSKKETRTGKTMPAWAKSPEEMEDKTAAKQLLKKPAKMSEGLAMALSADSAPMEPPEPPSKDVRERVGARMTGVAEPADFTVEPEPPAPEAPAGSTGVNGAPPTGPQTAAPGAPAGSKTGEGKSALTGTGADAPHLGPDGKPELF